MKNLWIYGTILSLLILSALSVNGQIEVHSGGKVSIGGNPVTRPACQAFINGASSGEALHVEHNNFTPWSSAIGANVHNSQCCSYNLWMNGATQFYVTGSGDVYYAHGAWLSSDSSLKKNIVRLSGTLALLDKINGYNYRYRENVTIDKGIEKGTQFVADTFLHAGFMANEIQQIAPYAVKEMINGKLAVNYEQIIPFLLEGIKELNNINKQQAEQLNLLQSRFNNLANNLDSTNGNYKMGANKTSTDFTLYQNHPNPFDKETSISYSLKGSYSSASIYIFDLSGSLKKSYSLAGSGTITVKSSELTAGLYLYTLVVDGNQIDTKRMLLTN